MNVKSNVSKQLMKNEKAKKTIRAMFKGGWKELQLAKYWKTSVPAIKKIIKEGNS